jgi:hypothetical protein
MARMFVDMLRWGVSKNRKILRWLVNREGTQTEDHPVDFNAVRDMTLSASTTQLSIGIDRWSWMIRRRTELPQE